MMFRELMIKRDYDGELMLDHEHKTLTLNVHTNRDEAGQGEPGRDTKTLSGGEKSFSTICLLLALWESISSPFRALDEFDVFMVGFSG
jgi:chromosome segregation ATPase